MKQSCYDRAAPSNGGSNGIALEFTAQEGKNTKVAIEIWSTILGHYGI